MELGMVPMQQFNCLTTMDAAMKEREMTHYSSELGLDSSLHNKVIHAMKLFSFCGYDTNGNFKRIFRCSSDGLEVDWRLSEKAYKAILFGDFVPDSIIYGYLAGRIPEDVIYTSFVKDNVSPIDFNVKPDICQA